MIVKQLLWVSQCGHNVRIYWQKQFLHVTMNGFGNKWWVNVELWRLNRGEFTYRLQNNYCVVESMWSCMAETVCACDNEELLDSYCVLSQ